MKLPRKLLLTVPFIIVTFLYLRLSLADNGCWGFVELIYSVILWILLAVTSILAIVSILRKRQSESIKTDKYPLTVVILTFLILIVGSLWGDGLKASIWLEAKSEAYLSQPSSVDLTLRIDNTFKVQLNEADFSCFYTGTFTKSNDTLHFEKETIAKTEFKMTTSYVLQGVYLTPVSDTSKDKNNYTKFELITK